MNRTLAREITGCLRVSGPPTARLDRLPAFGKRDWERTLKWLDHSGLALPFWSRLKQAEAESVLPCAVSERLRRNSSDHCARVMAMLEEFGQINRGLEGAGLRYAALKGFTLIPEYCPAACLRTTYDFDYLLPRESMDQADCAMKALGYARKKEQAPHPLVYFHRPPRSPTSCDDLYSPDFPRTVELHFLFWDAGLTQVPIALTEDPLLNLRIRSLTPPQIGAQDPLQTGQDRRFWTLCEEDELVFQVLHAFRHILQNWCRLCSLLDIAYFLDHRALDAAFWDRFCERLKESRPLSEIVGVVFLLAARLFGGNIPASVSSQTVRCLRSPLALWVDRYGLDSALNNFSDNKFSLFLHHEFVQDDAVWRSVKRKSLYPWRRPNQAIATSSPQTSARFGARLKQTLYVAKRIKHHFVSSARYGFEARRWAHERAHAGDLDMTARPGSQ